MISCRAGFHPSCRLLAHAQTQIMCVWWLPGGRSRAAGARGASRGGRSRGGARRGGGALCAAVLRRAHRLWPAHAGQPAARRCRAAGAQQLCGPAALAVRCRWCGKASTLYLNSLHRSHSSAALPRCRCAPALRPAAVAVRSRQCEQPYTLCPAPQSQQGGVTAQQVARLPLQPANIPARGYCGNALLWRAPPGCGLLTWPTSTPGVPSVHARKAACDRFVQ